MEVACQRGPSPGRSGDIDAPGDDSDGSFPLARAVLCRDRLLIPCAVEGRDLDAISYGLLVQVPAAFVRFPPGFGWSSQVLPGPERRQTYSAHCASMRRDDSEF